ncbi:uncharacterized protein MAM_08428 [Metarhizium album ARSEF 1941]|uniref:Uncharacterized protein n=1 Tax=Metarhizium album (strain ARSEF 1941) TaxID=1081103 RepID=A0A0B2WL21_METAS|nr:uncharacterized protein MAM_08428 [Metarhizium album ARSEF 1941]KHN93715.1 hypothetical protein MAM_08428 [Metarhizium album ARSEF 1941]
MSLPGGKNPFNSVGKWNLDNLKNVAVEIDEVKETTSDFTRRKNPKNRYWKAFIKFKSGPHESKVIKMYDCDIPYVKSTNYGTDYILARLQKVVGEKIVEEALKHNIVVNLQDKRAASDENNWWMTINNTSGRIGVVDSSANFEPQDLGAIFAKTEDGVKLNLDLVFSVRLTKTDNSDRASKDVFNLVADCSRGSIKAIRQEIEAPSVEASIPQQPASKADIAGQELIDAINGLLV